MQKAKGLPQNQQLHYKKTENQQRNHTDGRRSIGKGVPTRIDIHVLRWTGEGEA